MKERMRKFIDSKYMSIREFERECGVSSGLLNNMERGFGKKDKIFKTKIDKKCQ